jgi:tetratricopeptide (TPR) repeat protein
MFDFHDSLRHDDELQLINQRVFDAAAEAGHEIAQAYAALCRAELSANRGQQRPIMPDLEFARAILRRHRDRLPMATLNAELIMANTMRVRGETAAALLVAAELVDIAVHVDDPRAEAAAQHCLGTCLSWSSDHHAALQAFQRGLKLYEQAESPTGMSLCLMRIGSEHSALGCHRDADRELQHALQLSSADQQSRPFILLALAENAVAANRPAAARRHLQCCGAALERHPNELLTARMLFNAGRINDHERAHGPAGHDYRRAHRLATRAGAVVLANTIQEHITSLTAYR